MPYPLPLTRTEAYLAYKAGVIQQSDLKPSLAVPRNGIDAWLAYWTGLTTTYPVKNVGKNLFDIDNLEGHHFYNSSTYKPNSENLDWDCSQPIPVESNTTYTISVGLKSGASFTNAQIIYWDANKNGVGSVWGDIRRTLTTGANVSFITIAYNNKVWENAQLEKGSTATAYEPYTGEPLILQEEEAYIAYLCGVINEYPEKCLRRVGAYLRYLISARWGRPDHPLNREELYLSLIKTQVIPSGNPSSDIVIDGTAKAPFVDVKLYGDTFQQSYEGKNLVNTFDMVEVTNSGLAITKGSDGAIIFNGTQTGVCNLRLNVTDYFSGLVGENFTISVATSGVGTWSNFGFKTPNVAIVSTVTPGTPTRTVTLNVSGTNEYWFDLYIANGGTVFTDYKVYIQVEKGSAATSYEPYVGGTPSPNPDYPQPIQTVTGRQVVNVSGKNLFDATATPWVKNIAYNNAGQQNWYGYYGIDEYQPVEASTQYTFSNNLNKPIHYGIAYYNSSKSLISTTTADTTTFTTPANCAYIRFAIESSAAPTWTQLELGSTATVYEPYSSNDYEINLGKNLFNRNDVVNGIPSQSDGSIVSTSSIGRTSGYIPVMANTAYSHTGHPLGWAVVAWYKADKSFIGRVGDVKTVTSPSGAAYARVSCAQGDLDTCQFEAGEPTDYAPYFTPIELCKLGTYQDFIWKDGEDWKVHKEITQKVFNGSEQWSKSIATLNNVYIQVDTSAKKDTAVKSDKLTEYTASYMQVNSVVGIAYNTTGGGEASIRISCGIDGAADIPTFRGWLNRVAPKAYYAKATPTDTVITNQALIDQLDALKQGGAENGTTYIKVNATDPNLPGLLYVEAPKYE